jgi:hypothetical protein
MPRDGQEASNLMLALLAPVHQNAEVGPEVLHSFKHPHLSLLDSDSHYLEPYLRVILRPVSFESTSNIELRLYAKLERVLRMHHNLSCERPDLMICLTADSPRLRDCNLRYLTASQLYEPKTCYGRSYRGGSLDGIRNHGAAVS